MFLSQDVIVRNIGVYLELKNNANGAAVAGHKYDADQGLCAGLVAYWLYLMRNDEEGFFMHRLQYASNWDEQSFKNSGNQRDDILESFLDNVLLLHEPGQIISTAKQSDLNVSFKLGLASHQDQVSSPEFSLTFIFNKEEIKNLISSIVFPNKNKMVRLSNGLHVIGLMYKNNTYILYDPNSKDGPIESADENLLADKIYSSFASYCKSKNYIAINILVYDFSDSKLGVYFDPFEYCLKKIANPTIKNEVMQHKFLFFILAKYNEFKIIELLFERGYKYIPWKYHGRTELNEAVLFHDNQKVKYLIEHDLPIDYKNLQIAIEQKSTEMLYTLLLAGADVNYKQQKSYFMLALEHDFPEGMVLLLSGGIEIGAKEKEAVKHKYSSEGMHMIFSVALKLHKKIMKIADVIELNQANGSDLIAYALHYKLALQLELTLDDVILTKDNIAIVNNKNIIFNLVDKFKTHSLDEMLRFNQKEELEGILRYLAPKVSDLWPAEKKLADLKDYATKISFKLLQDNTEVTNAELLDAKLITEKMPTLYFELDVNQDAAYEQIQKQIETYLQKKPCKNYKSKSNNTLFMCNYTTKDKPDISYKNVESFFSNWKYSY